jgi:two-component system sensor histidine kinase DegS
MKQDRIKLSQTYLDALRAHLGTRRVRSSPAARRMGRAMVISGLSAVDLARMHDRALAALALSHDFANARNGLIRRAGRFFADALQPMERLQRATERSVRQLQERAVALRQSRVALARGQRGLQREIERRKASEAEVRRGRERYQLLFAQSQVMQKQLRHLAQQILLAQEQERREISRELHDEVVQILIGINVELAALGTAASIGSRALKVKIARTQRLVEKSVSVVHQFARELRPALLDDLGLVPALHAYMKGVTARRKLKIHLTAFKDIEEMDIAGRTVLYRVAQEALTNVVRHAEATAVRVSLTEVAGSVRMEVHDNGKSFRVPDALSPRTNKRLGLLGMRERVEMIGGTLTIDSAPGRGTTVRAEVPFTKTNRRATR